MKNYSSKLDKKIAVIIKSIGRLADENRLQAYVVGGFVRDIILKKENLDLDVVVEKDAIALARKYAQSKRGGFVNHDRFGTATVSLKSGLRVDFATARKESYSSSGALPNVGAGSIQDDLYRRDFTINAMAIELSKLGLEALVDSYGGFEDLKNKRIRILHNKSFCDDPTRILRAIRFEQRLQFCLERGTLQRLKEALAKNYPARVKSQRYFGEFKKILLEEKPKGYLQRLNSFDGLRFLGPGFTVNFHRLGLIEKNIAALKSKSYIRDDESWWIVYFMGLVSNCSPIRLTNMLHEFNLNKRDRSSILMSLHANKFLEDLKQKRLTPSDIYKILKPLSRETILYLYTRTKTNFVQKRIENFLVKHNSVELHINGHDLKRLGIHKGKEIKSTLNYVLYRKIDKNIHSRREELNEVRKLKSSKNVSQ